MSENLEGRWVIRVGKTTDRVTTGRSYKFITNHAIKDDNGHEFRPVLSCGHYWQLQRQGWKPTNPSQQSENVTSDNTGKLIQRISPCTGSLGRFTQYKIYKFETATEVYDNDNILRTPVVSATEHWELLPESLQGREVICKKAIHEGLTKDKTYKFETDSKIVDNDGDYFTPSIECFSYWQLIPKNKTRITDNLSELEAIQTSVKDAFRVPTALQFEEMRNRNMEALKKATKAGKWPSLEDFHRINYARNLGKTATYHDHYFENLATPECVNFSHGNHFTYNHNPKLNIKQEKTMKIETNVTLINDNRSTKYTQTQLLDFIRQEKKKLDKLNKLDIKSEAVDKLKYKHELNIERLIKVLDKNYEKENS